MGRHPYLGGVVMRTPLLLVVVLIALAVQPTVVQTPQWPEYTQEQRWSRAALMSTLGAVSALAYAKARGTSLEQFGRWWGDMFAPSWGEPGSYGPFEVMRGMRRNFLCYPDMEVEILSQSESAVSARLNRPWVAHFDDQRALYGVSLEEFDTLQSMFMRRVADYHGLAFEERREGERLIVTFSRR
jgi:hypothetical protein